MASAALTRFADLLRQYRYDEVGFAREVLGVELHEGQARFLRSATSPENAVVAGNRWGKSFTAAVRRIHRCTYRKGWTKSIEAAMLRKHEPYYSVNASISADQAHIVWNKAYGLLQGPKSSWLIKDVKLTPFPRMTFISGAVFEARSTARDGMYLLGHDYDDINWDEVAQEKKFLKIRDNVMRMRMVDRAGTMDYTTTGEGRNDFGLYFLTGLPGPKKDPYLYSQSGSTRENPFIDQSRVESLAARYSPRRAQQNIEGAIVDGDGDYFSIDDIEAAHDEALDSLDADGESRNLIEVDAEDVVSRYVVRVDGGSRSWHEKFPSHRYLHGWDLADKQDWLVGTTWDTSTTPMTLVEFSRHHKRGWDANWARIRERHHRYGTERATKIDATGIGDVAENELKDIKAEGVNFSGKKDALLTNHQTALAQREIRWPFIKPLVDEHKFYNREDEGLQTDCVMSCAVAMWFARHKKPELTIGSLRLKR